MTSGKIKSSMRVAILTCAFGVVFSCTNGFAQNPITVVLKRLDNHNKALQTLTADVTMVTYDAAIKLTDTRVGSIRYLPKRMKGEMAFRLDWRSENNRPIDESMTVIGDEVKLYQAKQKLLKTGKVQKSKEPTRINHAFAFLSMSRSEIEANYELAYIAVEKLKTGEDTWRVRLTPKKAGEFKTVEIWVDKDGMPRQFKNNRENGDYTGVLLSDIKKNERLDLSTFGIQLAPGTKTQKL